MIRRARLLAVVLIVACGAIGVISSTQTWLTVVLDDGAERGLAVPGASAIPVLAPLSLAVLALGGALSIVGLVLRYVFGALTAVIGALLAWLTAQVAFSHPTTAVAATVTEATGITGEAAVAALVASITATAWPVVTLVAWIVLLAAGVFAVVTAARWKAGDRRYRTDETATTAHAAGSRPPDAIDSWDDLSRGDDPTDRPLD
ncbi:Trp biosynthesis-associated membrane protein [Microbacterium sp. CFBP9034]|uniref:Trp biosynthesis-associated membrane protein n=1 Tax=Microbacterium sp. CFBP9034 TaxID=3096540 RepID=UPI002A69D4E1|nr:Trp biosynthesis-associated membrane protein [Microbacterium sp. CFBP9034]MDY0909799.1 Trp biosynthesis-associated membrane protein [Microbacterium sp. CFBP9034]